MNMTSLIIYRVLLTELINFLSIIFVKLNQAAESKIPKWVNINKRRFNEILSTVTKAKKEGLRPNENGKEITLNNTESLLKDLGNGLVDGHEFKNRYNDIADDIEAIVNTASITRSQEKIVQILLLLKEISKPKKSDEQPDTIYMPELESEESAAERRNIEGKGPKILTPNQMFSRLPITLAQLKARNNSQKLKNEIRQLLYSLYRSKKLTKQLYKSLVDII